MLLFGFRFFGNERLCVVEISLPLSTPIFLFRGAKIATPTQKGFSLLSGLGWWLLVLRWGGFIGTLIFTSN